MRLKEMNIKKKERPVTSVITSWYLLVDVIKDTFGQRMAEKPEHTEDWMEDEKLALSVDDHFRQLIPEMKAVTGMRSWNLTRKESLAVLFLFK